MRQGYCFMSNNFPSDILLKLRIISLLILFPLCVVIFGYSRMVIAINRHSKSFSDANQSSTQHVRERRMFKAKVNIFTTMVVVCLCYFSCWILNVIVLSLMAFDILPASYFTSPFYDISVNLAFLQCCINPFVRLLLRHCFARKTSRMRPHWPCSLCLQLRLI